MTLFSSCIEVPLDFSNTGRTGEFLRPIFTGTEEGTDLLLNTAYNVHIKGYTDVDGVFVSQPGVQVFLRFANDEKFDDEIFPDVEILQFDPGDEDLERWVGVIPKTSINLIPAGSFVYISFYRLINGETFVDDVYGFYVVGGV